MMGFLRSRVMLSERGATDGRLSQGWRLGLELPPEHSRPFDI